MKTSLKHLGLFVGYVATVLVIGGCQSSQLACCTPDGSATAMSAVQTKASQAVMTPQFAAIGLTGTLLWLLRSTAWAVPLFVLQGVLINFLYAGQHEFSHSTVFKTRRLN